MPHNKYSGSVANIGKGIDLENREHADELSRIARSPRSVSSFPKHNTSGTPLSKASTLQSDFVHAHAAKPRRRHRVWQVKRKYFAISSATIDIGTLEVKKIGCFRIVVKNTSMGSLSIDANAVQGSTVCLL